MTAETIDDGNMRYAIPEVAGVFPDQATLEQAVEQLGVAGIDREAISVRPMDQAPPGTGADRLRPANAVANDPAARQGNFVSLATRTEAGAALVTAPLLVCGLAAAWIAAAQRASLSTTIAVTVLSSAAGAAVGFLLYRALARTHAKNVQRQLASGGLVLWVSTPETGRQQNASEIMRRCGATSVHAHTGDREWGVANTPLNDVQPDPFLERTPTGL
jgi:hypothetical protein